MTSALLLLSLLALAAPNSPERCLVAFEDAIEDADALIVGDYQGVTGETFTLTYGKGESADGREYVQIRIANAIAIVNLKEPVISHEKELSKNILLDLLEVSEGNKTFHCDVYISAPTIDYLKKGETRLWSVEKSGFPEINVASLLSNDYTESQEIIASVKSGTLEDGSTVQ